MGRLGGLARRDAARSSSRRSARPSRAATARARARALPPGLRPARARSPSATAAGIPRHEELYDVYPDAAGALARLRAAGVRVGVAGNQPAGAEASLAGLSRPGDLVATSAAWGVSQARPGVLRARSSTSSSCRPSEIAYVGDRVDNDILPAAAAGMFTVHLRRGPWGVIQAAWPEAATRRRRSPTNLDEAVDAILAASAER